MVLSIKVKTLESNVYDFDVDENMTVEQFKEFIAGQVNVPADRQRLIFCGRVLNDNSKKLMELNLNSGQVLHLVQKPPPSLNNERSQSSSSSQRTENSSHRNNRDDGFLVGAFSFPQEAIDANGLQQVVESVVSGITGLGRNATVRSQASEDGSSLDVHINLNSVPIQSEVQQRISHANRIIRYINRILDDIEGRDIAYPSPPENSGATTPTQNTMNNQNHAEESGVATSNSPVDSNGAANQVQINIQTSGRPNQESQSRTNANRGGTSPNQVVFNSLEAQIAAQAASAFAAATANAMSSFGIQVQPSIVIQGANGVQRSANVNSNNDTRSTDSATSQSNSEQTGANARRQPGITDNRVPASELINLLTTVQNIQERYRIHLQRYQQLIANEAAMNSFELNEAQRLQRNILRMTHHLSHVNHIISDLSVDFSQPPPRTVRLTQTFGIPIPVAVSTHNIRVEATHPIPTSQNLANNNNNNTTNNNNNNNNNINNNNNNNNNNPVHSSADFVTVGSTTSSTYSIPRFSQSNTNGQSNPVFVAQGPIVFMEVGPANAERSQGTTPSRNQQTTSTSTSTSNYSTFGYSNFPPNRVPTLSNTRVSFFDPFLPCNSQFTVPEIRTRVSLGFSTDTRSDNSSGQQSRPQTNVQGVPMPNINQVVSGIMDSLLRSGNLHGPRQAQPTISVDSSLVDLIGQLRNEQTTNNQQPNENQSTGGQPNMTDMFVSFVNGIVQIINGQNNTGTVSDFLNGVQGFSYNEGESIINDVFMVMARGLNFQDLFQILFFGNPQPLDGVRDALNQFSRNNILSGLEPNESNINIAVNRIVNQWSGMIQTAQNHVRVVNGIDFEGTINNFLRTNVTRLIRLFINPPQNNFGQILYNDFRTMITEFANLCISCFEDGTSSFLALINSLVRNFSFDLHPLLQDWMATTATRHAGMSVAGLNNNPQSTEHYIVRRERVDSIVTNETDESMNVNYDQASNASVESMEVENNEFKDALSEIDMNEEVNNERDQELNNSILIGSETWHSAVPHDWIPIITSDLQAQRRQPLQRPLSDAYLNGMPKKRRKVERRSANYTLSSAFRDSLQSAIVIAEVHPISSRTQDEIIKEADNNNDLQLAFRQQLRSEIINRLHDSDYNPDRFTNTKNYITN